ncbi:MAG: adenylate/guanylate cyclase domain-containing protein [Actinomycetota bacterium]|nr:adenylate/guanylate cyclase domain-containing protein [Actinomycetota bacterium]
MNGLPDGVVTFVFTDIEGSTRLWEDAPDVMMDALRQHDDAIDGVVAAHNGQSVKPRGEGDSRFLVFANAVDAVAAASEIQTRLAEIDWVSPRPIRVRSSVHTGMADLQLGDYYGAAVNRAARLRAIGHGGQTLLSRSTWELAQDGLPAGVTITDLGEHMLKDLTRPEHVYQLNPPGIPQDFPPAKSLGAVPNNLPQQLTDFVGRESELGEAQRLLHHTRLLTILAPGGTGKSRLAIQLAADVTEHYPDGVYFISLAEVGHADDVIQAVAESIGIAFSSDERPQDQLHKYLANKTQLLVFDNFEHVIDAAAVVSGILRATSSVCVVVTSRAKLNVSGETVLALGGLETSWEIEEEALGTSGVRLFLDAAKRSDASFSLDSEDLDPLEKILGLTGGMPLGILLAAAWVDVLPIGEIATEIEKSLDFLETQMGDVPDRHRSVRAVFDYSWELLTPTEREVYTALSVFRGGFSREAADRVAGASLRDVATLVNKSLITPSASKDRYSLHELLRQFAASELDGDGDRSAQVKEAHAAFYKAEMERVAVDFVSQDQLQVLANIERDLENVRVAWRHAVARKDAALGQSLVLPLVFLYEVRGWYPAGASLFAGGAEAFAGSGEGPDSVMYSLARASETYCTVLLGQPNAETALSVVDIARRSGDPIGYWISLQAAAITMAHIGDADKMVEVTGEMITTGERIPGSWWTAGGKNWQTLAVLMQGDLEKAHRLMSEAKSVFEPSNEYYMMSWTLWLEALIATTEQRFEDAIRVLGRQVERSRTFGYRRATMVGYEALGQAQESAGDFESAERSYIESLAVAEGTGVEYGVLSMMVRVANLHGRTGSEEDAVALLGSVIAEPRSAQQTMSDPVPVIDMATEVLDRIKPQVGAGEYAAAYQRGSAEPYDVAAKRLIESIR